MVILPYQGGGDSGLSIITGPTSYGETYFTVRIANYGDRNVYSTNIRINKSPQENEEYTFRQHNGDYYSDGPNYPQMVVITKEKGETQWYRSGENSGSIIFTRIDARQKIFSGTFEATLYNRFDKNKIMKITKGRFDINLNK